MKFISKTSKTEDQWLEFVQAIKLSKNAEQNPWYSIFGAFGTPGQVFVIGQLGQSLDGRIATPTGDSKYINGEAGLIHLHRLRALVDAVVVGIGTAWADDPMLTVRKIEGPQPARVVIDSTARLSQQANVWQDNGARRLVITNSHSIPAVPSGVEHITLATQQGQLAPADILSALASRGFKRILIEGGADTIARFMHAGCLNRLHLIVAPIILGSGRTGLCLNEIKKLNEAIRPVVHAHPLDGEVLFDCDLSPTMGA